MAKRRTKVDVRKVIKMRRDGARIETIAQECRCSIQYAYRLVRMYRLRYGGISTDYRHYNARREGVTYDRGEVMRLFRGGIDITEISQRLGCSRGYIYKVINEER